MARVLAITALVALPALPTACATTTTTAATTTPSSGESAPPVKAWSGTLIDRRTGVVLWQKDGSRRLPPASCTKIMTALVVLEHVKHLDRYVRVPGIPLPQKVGVNLRPGDRISVGQALRALMVKSANDAALTLASHVGGSERGFVALMNARAASLGLHDTHFVNCRGTYAPGHYSSAADLAALARYAMRDPRFRALVRIRRTVIVYPPKHAVPVESHNRLLDYPWGTGIKTGATSASKMVLVGSGQPGLVPLIVVTMHEPSRNREERDAVALFKWGSSLYGRRTLATAGEQLAAVPIDAGGETALVASTSLRAVLRKAAPVKESFSLPTSLPSLPPPGTAVGSVAFYSDGLKLGAVTLVARDAADHSSSPSR